jgi:hypothetical protein
MEDQAQHRDAPENVLIPLERLMNLLYLAQASLDHRDECCRYLSLAERQTADLAQLLRSAYHVQSDSQ